MSLVSGLATVMVALLILVGWARRKRSVPRSRGVPRIDDEALRQIVDEGRLSAEEPLDLEQARTQEEQFWRDEAWDEAEEW